MWRRWSPQAHLLLPPLYRHRVQLLRLEHGAQGNFEPVELVLAVNSAGGWGGWGLLFPSALHSGSAQATPNPICPLSASPQLLRPCPALCL